MRSYFWSVFGHFSCSENDYLMVAFHRFTISIWFYRAEHNLGVKRGRGSQESDQFKHLSKKIQEVTLNVVITEKNGKKCVRLQLSIPWAQRSFWVKLPLILRILLMNEKFKLLKILLQMTPKNDKMISKYKCFQMNFHEKLLYCVVSGTNFVYTVFVS